MMLESLVTRNEENILTITQPSCWINDVQQKNGSFKVEVALSSMKNWLQIRQQHGDSFKLYPIDGEHGVFKKGGLPVQNPDDFLYEWTQIDPATGLQQTESLRANDCDCLIVHEHWHLFEFKTNAASLNISQIQNNYNKAEKQLAKTLSAFREQLSSNTNVFCTIVQPRTYPKTNAEMINRAVKFKKKFQADLRIIHTDEAYSIAG